jgi:excinuclease UvrABC nuclease subunit
MNGNYPLFRKYPIHKNLPNWQRCPLFEADIWLPPCPGVYMMTKKTKGTFVYAGKAMNLNRRFSAGHHKLLAALREGAKHLHYLPMDVTEEELNYYEVVLINSLQPSINVYHTDSAGDTFLPVEKLISLREAS